MKTHKSMTYSHKVASASGSALDTNRKSAREVINLTGDENPSGSRVSTATPPRGRMMLKRGQNRNDLGEDDAISVPSAKRRRIIKEEKDEDDSSASAPAPKKPGPGRRKKYVEKEKEEVIDWDALRAPTPPGSCPTPPWRHEKWSLLPLRRDVEDPEALPTGANPILLAASNSRSKNWAGRSSDNNSNVNGPTANESASASAMHSKAAGSYPTPPLQPYDLTKAQAQGQGQGQNKVQGQSQNQSSRWGSKMVNWDQSMPEGDLRYSYPYPYNRTARGAVAPVPVQSPSSAHYYYYGNSGAVAGQGYAAHDQVRQSTPPARERGGSSDTQSLTQSPQQSRMKINHLLND